VIDRAGNRAEHYIFDLDGTLIDSAPGVLCALQQTARACGVLPTVPIDRNLIGPPLMKVLKILSGWTDPVLLGRLADTFRCFYDNEAYAMSVPFPGVEEALRRLRAQGSALHIATNKRSVPTHKIVALLGWDGSFASIRCIDSQPQAAGGKEGVLSELIRGSAIDPQNALMVGDSIDDAAAATHCGIRFLAVTWGYGCAQLFGQHPKVDRIDSAGDL
jgi:phosphoglycolate phosphatase